MSRSYKKSHIYKDHNKGMKSVANKHLRRKLKDAEDLPKRNSYKKIFESWNISDYKFRFEDCYFSRWLMRFVSPGKFKDAKWEDKKLYKK